MKLLVSVRTDEQWVKLALESFFANRPEGIAYHFTVDRPWGVEIVEEAANIPFQQKLVAKHPHVKALAILSAKVRVAVLARGGDLTGMNCMLDLSAHAARVVASVANSGRRARASPLTRHSSSRRLGTQVVDDEEGNHPFSLYVGGFVEKRPGAAKAALKEIECPYLRRYLMQLLAQAEAARCTATQKLASNYMGETTTSGAFLRFHGLRGHKTGKSGATKFGRWLNSEIIAKYFHFYHRLLARPAHAREAKQLEMTGAQLACVGNGRGANEAVCGPCPFGGDAYKDYAALDFCRTISNQEIGGLALDELTFREARRAESSKKKKKLLPRAARGNSSDSRAQILANVDIINKYPCGVEGLARFAASDTAAVEFVDFQAQ